jgi:hypothetical protein
MLATKERVLQYFNEAAQPLFAILDGARNGRVASLLKDFGILANISVNRDQQREDCRADESLYQSLYIGTMASESAEQGPFLVRMLPQSPLLGAVIAEGWGDSWGVFVESAATFVALWRHFRKFILAEMPDGTPALFRFYDPRVLRGFLPTCDREQLESIFALPISFLLEDSEVRLVRFVRPQPTDAGGYVSGCLLIP